MRPLLRKRLLDPSVLANYCPVLNVPFVGKVVEQGVAEQLQAFLEDILDLFQSGF